MNRYLLLLLTISLISCKNDDVVKNPWNAEQLAQEISSNPKWEKDYKEANIVTETKFVAEFDGDRTVKTLYPETENELTVIYNGTDPQELYWVKSGDWTTDYGTVGEPITVLEKANEAGIKFYGLGYDLPGMVKIDSGKLAAKKITFAVRPTSDIIPTEYYSNASFDTTTPEVKKLKLYITRVQMEIPKKVKEVE